MKILFGLIEIDKKGIKIPLARIHIPFYAAFFGLKYIAQPVSAFSASVTDFKGAVQCSAHAKTDFTADGINDLLVGCNEDSPWSCLRYSQPESSVIPFSDTSSIDNLPSDFYLTTQDAQDLKSACEADRRGHLMGFPNFHQDRSLDTPLIFSSQPECSTPQKKEEQEDTAVSKLNIS